MIRNNLVETLRVKLFKMSLYLTPWTTDSFSCGSVIYCDLYFDRLLCHHSINEQQLASGAPTSKIAFFSHCSGEIHCCVDSMSALLAFVLLYFPQFKAVFSHLLYCEYILNMDYNCQQSQ